MRQEDGPSEHGGEARQGSAQHRFAVAFQPIVDVPLGRVLAHEALLRGLGGSTAHGVLGRVAAADRPAFEMDSAAAIITAFGSGEGDLHVNLSPGALLRTPRIIPRLAGLLAASPLAPSRLVIEVTEGERVRDAEALGAVMAEARACGFRLALDHFGTGYEGLGLLGEIGPDLVKLDGTLVRGIDRHRTRRPIVSRLLDAAGRLGIPAVAVGVETEAEFFCLASLGVTLFQGFLVCPPATGRLVPMQEIVLPARHAARARAVAPHAGSTPIV